MSNRSNLKIGTRDGKKTPPLVFLPYISSLSSLFKRKEERFTKRYGNERRDCFGTAGTLTCGLICFRKANTHQSQIMMQANVHAQGFIVAAVLGSIMASAIKSRSEPICFCD
uniref:HIG1 domain-containing protein n=1 Tax=Salvator merianae TaxID=96440 RepID=A0A8D0BZI0_SALMN